MTSSRAVDSIVWGIEPEWQRPAILYTIRTLCSLLGRPAVITAPGDLPDSGPNTILYTGDSENAAGPLTIPCTSHFWAHVENGEYVEPLGTIDWNGTTLPVWST